MNEEVAIAFEIHNHILAAAPDVHDAFSLEGACDRRRRLGARQPLVENGDAHEPPADEG